MSDGTASPVADVTEPEPEPEQFQLPSDNAAAFSPGAKKKGKSKKSGAAGDGGALNRTFGSTAYKALDPSEEIEGMSLAKIERKVRKEEARMARVVAEEQQIQRRRQKQEQKQERRQRRKQEGRKYLKQDWSSTVSLPDIRAAPGFDPADCYGRPPMALDQGTSRPNHGYAQRDLRHPKQSSAVR